MIWSSEPVRPAPAEATPVLYLLVAALLLFAGTPALAGQGGSQRTGSTTTLVQLTGEDWREVSFIGNLRMAHRLAGAVDSSPKVVMYSLEHRSGAELVRLSPLHSGGDGADSYWLASPDFGVLVDPARSRYFINSDRLWLDKLKNTRSSLAGPGTDQIDYERSATFLERPAVRVEGPGFELIVDRSTGVPLLWRKRSASGRVTDYFEFVSFARVNSSEVPAERFRIPADFQMVDLRRESDGRRASAHRKTQGGPSEPPFYPLVPARLPTGWFVHDMRLKRIDRSESSYRFYHIQLVNEREPSFVSIFQFPGGTLSDRLIGDLTSDANRTVVSAERAEIDVLLVGEISRDELGAISESLVEDRELSELLLSLVSDIDTGE